MERRDYTKEILTLYRACKGNASEAETMLKNNGINICSETIRNTWRSNGFAIKHGGPRKRRNGLSQDKIDYIISTGPRYDWKPSLAAQNLRHLGRGYSHENIRKIYNEYLGKQKGNRTKEGGLEYKLK